MRVTRGSWIFFTREGKRIGYAKVVETQIRKGYVIVGIPWNRFGDLTKVKVELDRIINVRDKVSLQLKDAHFSRGRK